MTEYAWVIMKKGLGYSTVKLIFEGDEIEKETLGAAPSVAKARLLLPDQSKMTCSPIQHLDPKIVEWWFLEMGQSPHDPASRSIN